MYLEMQFEAAFYEQEVDYIFKDAQGSVAKQRHDISEFIKQNVDAIIVFPTVPDSLPDLVTMAYDNGIKVVVADREIKNARYNCFVGTDDWEIGRNVASYIGTNFSGNLSIVQLMGPQHSLTSNARGQGFNEILSRYPNLKVNAHVYGDWDAQTAFRVSDSLLATGCIPDVVFAHNDMMGYQMFLACQKHHISPIIIGVDGIAAPHGGIEMVLNRQLHATFFNPSGGKESINYAMSLLNGQTVPKTEWLESFLIDTLNAPLFKRQFATLNDQYLRITKQRELINIQYDKLSNQRTVMLMSFALIVLFLALIGWVLFSLFSKMKLIKTIESQKQQIEAQMLYQQLLLDELKEKSQLLKEQKDEIEAQRDAIYAQNQELEAYGSEMEMLVAKRTDELKMALEKARESDRLKTAFLSNLSHEIRTPLNAIVGFSELFCEPDKDFEERMGLQKVIRKNTRELLSLIDHVLELSMLTTGQVALEKKQCSVNELFSNIMLQIKQSVDDGYWPHFDGVELNLVGETDMQINVDCAKLMEIVMHLAQNALKHTHKGSVEIGWSIINQEKKLRVFVADTGVGIPTEYQQVVFEMFRKVESHSLVLYRGAGMGLTIVKHLAELMGANVKFESEIGKGSHFWLDIEI